MEAMTVDQGLEALQDCESRLRCLVAKAAAGGDYEAVRQLADWAQGVAALRSLPPDSAPSHRRKRNASRGAPTNGSAPASNPSGHRKKARSQRKRKSATVAYPKFARGKNELVKIGWSKKEKSEYQHKAPRQVIDFLIDSLLKTAPTEEVFTTERLFPLGDGNDGTEIPSYQAYLCLAWLREEQLVEQVGRQGYRVTDSKGLHEAMKTRWEQLPDRM